MVVWPFDTSSKSPVKVPSCAAASQPSAWTLVPCAWLYAATPSTKPSMKRVTGGWLPPPKVPTLPVSLTPAAR